MVRFFMLLVFNLLTVSYARGESVEINSQCETAMKTSLFSLFRVVQTVGVPLLEQYVRTGSVQYYDQMGFVEKTRIQTQLVSQAGRIQTYMQSCARSCDGASEPLIRLCHELSRQSVSTIATFIENNRGLNGYHIKIKSMASNKPKNRPHGETTQTAATSQ